METEITKKTEEVARLKEELDKMKERTRHTNQNLASATSDILKANREKDEKDKGIAILRKKPR